MPARLRQPALFVSAAFFALLTWRLTKGVRGVHGGPASSLLHAEPGGWVRFLFAVCIAIVAGAAAAFLFGHDPKKIAAGSPPSHAPWSTGATFAGFTVFGAAAATGSVLELFREVAPSLAPGVPTLLAAEGVLVVLLGVVFVLAIGKASCVRGAWPSLPGVKPVSVRRGNRDGRFASLLPSLMALCLAVAVGGFAAWIVARSDLKGQTLAAALVAGVCGAAAAQPLVLDKGVRWWVPMLGVLLLAPLSQVAVVVQHGDGVLKAAYAGDLLALGWVQPLDWLAGALVGVPYGARWTDSMFERRLTAHAAAP